MKIKDIYEALRADGLTSSQMEFSRIWLGRSPRYYSHLIAVDREPGLATLCGISWRLKRMRLDNYPGLLDFQRQLAREIERRAITDVRRHRS
ncbi:hypothetical protein AGRHK599_LOCUS2073 [Rhizobium rhizogenes]|uniref:Uncharacterized protein n=1 Tax=Rhizobium rhizogenes TaxID=359 RepID=A0AAN2DDD1_RHIRH|nr:MULTISPECIES: DUF6626 family protein [Rhizobium/Agrobacterium group]AQS61039.1 hypothetical protein B0909_01220 [Rhizobium rhizogenes]MCZ7445399.1 hypothetical protein [Rhizobium rhizogenes]NSZ79810.1 hypothetical protein [Agrobacterium tumefaciens]OAM63931.1 hypothetical protein A8L48_12255 [Rhizobium rhizogenes]CAD0212797.1 hypothetical protein AGRHK599_LOCUS2073 [Rhizobium rhizogenes]